MRFLLTMSLLLLFQLSSFSQSSDMISLRKNNKVVQTFFKGQNIVFTTKNGAGRDALITDIKNDSIYLQEFLIMRRPTTYGGYILDTAGSFRYAYSYQDMYAFPPKEKMGFNLGSSGASLLGGGVLLSFVSGVVYLVDRNNFSPNLLIASVSAAALGFILSRRTGQPILVGKKKYNLQYINLQKDKP